MRDPDDAMGTLERDRETALRLLAVVRELSSVSAAKDGIWGWALFRLGRGRRQAG